MTKNKMLYISTIVIGAICLFSLFPFMVASPHYFAFINHDPNLLGWSWMMLLFNVIAVGLTVIFAMVCLFSKKIKDQYSLLFDNILTIVFYFASALNLFFALFITTNANGDLILYPFSIANYYYSIIYLIAFVIVMIRSRKLSKKNESSANI